MLVMDRLPIVLLTSNEVIIGEIPDITNALGWSGGIGKGEIGLLKQENEVANSLYLSI